MKPYRKAAYGLDILLPKLCQQTVSTNEINQLIDQRFLTVQPREQTSDQVS